jgi:hypothetical protein
MAKKIAHRANLGVVDQATKDEKKQKVCIIYSITNLYFVAYLLLPKQGMSSFLLSGYRFYGFLS